MTTDTAALRAKRFRATSSRLVRRCSLCGGSVLRGSCNASGWNKPWCLLCEIERLLEITR